MADNTEVISSQEHITAFDRFLKDGVANREKYHKWHSNLIVTVPANSYILVRKRFDKNNIRVEERGTILLNPLLEEYLFAPANITSIDYDPKKILTKNGIYLDIDLFVTISIVDPVTYYKSSNTALADLKDVIFGILNAYISKREMDQIREMQEYPLNTQDFMTLVEFQNRYGIRVEQIRNKTVGIPKEIETSKIATKTAEEDVRRAEFETKAATERAKAEIAYQESLIGVVNKLSEMGFSEHLIEKVVENNTIRNAPKGTSIFMGNMDGYNPAWFAMARQQGMLNGDERIDSNPVVVDENGNVINDDQGHGRTRRR